MRGVGSERTKDVLSARTPLASTGVGCRDLSDLLHRLAVPDVDGSAQVTETGEEEQATLRLKVDEVSGGEAEVVGRVGLVVEDDSLSGHVTVDDTKLVRPRVPAEVMDGSLLVERDAALEATSEGEQVEVGLSVVVLVSLVDVGLSEEEDHGSGLVPLDADLVGLEEVLAGRRCRGLALEVAHRVQTQTGGCAVLLSDKDSQTLSLGSSSSPYRLEALHLEARRGLCTGRERCGEEQNLRGVGVVSNEMRF